MFTVFYTLLKLMHFLYSSILIIRYYYMIFCRKCNKIWYAENSDSEIEMLIRGVSKTQKLPRHLVIVFGQKEESILDCIRIIGWCITLGIPYISFFDHDGFFKKNEHIFRTEFAKQKPNLVEQVIWGQSVVSTQNGITGTKTKLHVLLLSNVDGKGEIVSVTKALAKAVSAKCFDPGEIDIELLNKKLQFKYIPEPDLALIRGHICSTYGLLPWHARITEFFLLPSYVQLSAKDFVHLLDRYSKCQQRYGK